MLKIIILPLLLINTSIFSQTIYSGFVKNDTIVLSDVSVTLSRKNEKQIIAFSFSDEKGFFEIKNIINDDSIKLSFSAIGYKTKNLILANISQKIDCTLIEFTTELPTVIVKQLPINQQGDTTNYNVNQFKGKEDRVIGDVIAKLPGVEIDEATGQIKFNGKGISHYYVDGLDLLGARYNIANRNIPAELVDQVQILAHDKDIKLFDSLKSNNDPAVNIKLKKKAQNKFIGKGKVGVGATPLLYDNEITGLMFRKKMQFISSYKNNNAGTMLSNEIADNVSIQRVGEQGEKNTKEEILSAIIAANPPLIAKRYLLNNTHLLFFNVLKVLPNTSQVKFNLSYLNDYTTLQTDNNTTYFLPSGNVNFVENIKSFVNTNKINAAINYTQNKKSAYFKNNTEFGIEAINQNSRVQNNLLVNQDFSNPYYKFKNELVLFKPIYKTIVGFSSKININRMPQQLNVMPGQFNSIFNQTLPYEQVLQSAAINNFNTDNNLSFSKKIGKALNQIKIGVAYTNKNLASQASKQYNQELYNLNDSFKNNINWQNFRLYAENTISFSKGERTLDITLPLELNVIDVNNKISSVQNNQRRLFFNPSIDFNVPLFSKFTFGALYNYQNNTGTISQITNGFILKNYRAVSNNDDIIPFEHQQLVNVSLNYKNPLRAIFGNISISLSETKKNSIYSQQFVNYFVTSKLLLLPNKQQSVLIEAACNKYILEQKLNLSLNFTKSNFNTEFLQQNKLVTSNSQSFNASFKIGYNKISWFGIDAISKVGVFKNKIIELSSSFNTNSNFTQILKSYFFLTPKINFSFSNELYSIKESINKTQNYYFADLGITRKYKNTDVELVWNNITNNKTFMSIINNDNFRQVYQYSIRPSNVLIKFSFSF